MAQTPKTIQPYQELPKSMDFYHLRREGIRHVQDLSGNIWTDYNEHDPGVTILEQLCYALTELGYKTNYDIEVFLKNSLKKKGNHTFYAADDIFPCQPYTSTDYRKYIIYNIPEVKNVWLTPSTENIHNVRGLYNIRLQLDDVDLQKTEAVKQKVSNLLNANRNLCEDIERIEILQANKIKLTATIEIDAAFMGEEILANAIYKLQHFINPSVRRNSLEELLEEGLSYNQIFDGPVPKNGFIRDEDLKPLTTEIYVSRLSKIIQGIPGVMSVTNLVVIKDDTKIQGDLIPIDENMFPILDMNLAISEEDDDPIKIIKSGLLEDIDYSTTTHILTTLESSEAGNYESVIDITHEYSTPNIPLSEFQYYHSIQNHFPETYGIGPLGVASRAPLSRHGYAKQLKAYLLVFEQLMANHLAQLANVQRLFSLESGLNTTYFHQLLETVPELDSIVTNMDLIDTELRRINQKYEKFEERRGKFLDHLLARFNESFPTERLISNYKNVLPAEHRQKAIEEIINNKITFLKNYVKLGRERGRAFDYTQQRTGNLSGLHQRIGLLLNIKQPEGKISDIIKNSSISVFSLRDGNEPQARSIQLDEKEVRYESLEMETEDNTMQFFSNKESILEEVLMQGIFKRNYEIYENEGAYKVLFKTGRNHRLDLFKKDTLDEAKEHITKIVDYLYNLNTQSEGFHIIEHTLLRPMATTFYGLTLLDENNRTILEQYQYQSLERQELIAENLDKIGIERKNYIVEEVEDGFELILTEPGLNDEGEAIQVKIARYHELLGSEAEANSKVSDIIAFLLANYDNGTDIFTIIQFPVAEQRPTFLGDNYYTFQISIVLPRWCNRFNNEDFKKLLYQTIAANVPAHIKVEYLWMSYEDLLEFETVADVWLEEKRKTKVDVVRLDTASYIVAHLLKSYTLETPNSSLRSEVESAMEELGIEIE